MASGQYPTGDGIHPIQLVPSNRWWSAGWYPAETAKFFGKFGLAFDYEILMGWMCFVLLDVPTSLKL